VSGKISASLWIRAAVTAFVLAVMFRSISPSDAVATIGRLQFGAAAVVLVLLAIDRVVMIWRWMILLRASGQPISTKSAVWIYLVSSFVGSFLPAGVGGDVARAYTLYERTSQGSAAAASVAVDRLLGLLSIVAVGITGVALASSTRAPAGATIGAVVLLGAGAAAALWSDRWIRVATPESWRATAAGSRILRLADALSAYRGHRAALAAVSVLSVGVQLLRILQAYVLGLGLGIQVPLSYYLVFMPIGLIALMLPISISGFGAPQGLIVWMLRPAGVADPDSFALSTLIVLSGIIANLPGAFLYLRRGRSEVAATR
jgi:uncharacterized membrane protein YbhN (UPF0104 family)